ELEDLALAVSAYDKLARIEPRASRKAAEVRLAFRVANWPPSERDAARSARLTRAGAAELVWWMVPEVRNARVESGIIASDARARAPQPRGDPWAPSGSPGSRQRNAPPEPRRPPDSVRRFEAPRPAARDPETRARPDPLSREVLARRLSRRVRGGQAGHRLRDGDGEGEPDLLGCGLPSRARQGAIRRRGGGRLVNGCPRLPGSWTLPNFITLLRLAALPFFLFAIAEGRFGIALVIFVLAGISDGIDGYLARRFDMRSALGAYLDPIADKLLMMSSYL